MRVNTHISGFWLIFGVLDPFRGPGRIREGCFTSTPPPGAGEPEKGSGAGSRIPEGSGGQVPETSGTGSRIPEGIPYQGPRGDPGTGEPGSLIWDLRSPGVPESRRDLASEGLM